MGAARALQRLDARGARPLRRLGVGAAMSAFFVDLAAFAAFSALALWAGVRRSR